MTTNIDENIRQFKKIYSDCADVKMQEMYLGQGGCCKCFLAYIEVTYSGSSMNNSSLGRFTKFLENLTLEKIPEALDENRAGLAEFTGFESVEEAAQAMLTGDAVIFVDGYDKAFKLPDKGYPAMSVQETDSEKVIRGSNEGFADSIKVNTALVRRRLRSTRLKCREVKKGVRSHTNVDILYVSDLVKPGLVETVEQNLKSYVIDHVGDTGEIEQFAEKKWYSPFPEFQTTQRPDRAAMAVLEGRVVVLCDNSPIALILPTDFNSFLKTTDDYYNRFEAASFARIIRYVSAFLAMTLPGLYLAVTNFHTQILPTSLLLSFWEARIGCPFPEVVEVVLMELSFELLREAGIRLPGAMGNTIGIVGGLIIGQAAVDANLVSPIVVIVVAFTALCSFAIPSEEFAFSFRLLKFGFIALSAWLGYFGFLIGIYAVLVHLSRLESFGIPYLSPFVAYGEKSTEGLGESVIRKPFRMLKYRPIYARRNQRIRLRGK